MLSSTYFRKLHEKNSGGRKFSAYRPLGRPVILFSLIDGSPIASLHLTTSGSNEVDSKCVITERPENCVDKDVQFQGLINNDNQEFKLVISNLCTEGKINFNIFKQVKSKARTVDTVINNVNCLKPLQSYEIPCDKSTGKAMILKVSEQKETINKSERNYQNAPNNSDEVRKGTYLSLSVVPENKPNLLEKFRSTKWRCADFIYVTEKILQRNNFFESSPREYINFTESRAREYEINDDYFDYGIAADFDMSEPEDEGEDSSDDFDLFGARSPPRSNPNRRLGARRGMQSNGRFIGINTVGQRLRNPNLQLRGEPPNPRAQVEPFLLNSCGPDLLRRPLEIENNPVYDFPEESRENTLDCDVVPEESVQDVGKSLTADITYGQDVNEKFQPAVVDFAYHCPAEVVVIGLSVMENLQFIEPNIDEMTEEAKIQLDIIIKDGLKYLLDSLQTIYKSEECVICLDDAPDSVFYQCGHQCCHAKCAERLNKCPMCRSFISAKIVA